ncbi:MAG: PUA domain-containing protein [Acidianus sp.]
MKEFVTYPEKVSEFDFFYLKNIFAYQFGYDIAGCVFDNSNSFFIQRSINTNRIRNILIDNNLFLVLRAQDNLFSLTLDSAKKIKMCSKPPRFRVIIPYDIAKVVRYSGNVFAKHVIEVDKSLRAGDQVIVVDSDDNIVAVGRLKLSAEEIIEYKRGVAVIVKERNKNEGNP